MIIFFCQNKKNKMISGKEKRFSFPEDKVFCISLLGAEKCNLPVAFIDWKKVFFLFLLPPFSFFVWLFLFFILTNEN